jgi:hypothetical protein
MIMPMSMIEYIKKGILMKILLALLTLCLSFNAYSKITASVVKFKGEVLYNGKQITKTTLLEENGLVEVKDKSYLKLKVSKYNSVMALSANSKVRLTYPKSLERSPFIILDGLLRWTTQGPASKKGFIRTKNAAMAVRGTDFLVIVSELLGETEIYCFDGKVVFANTKNTKDKITVKLNDWGGIGGRFGSGVGEAVPMTETQIDHVKGLLK